MPPSTDTPFELPDFRVFPFLREYGHYSITSCLVSCYVWLQSILSQFFRATAFVSAVLPFFLGIPFTILLCLASTVIPKTRSPSTITLFYTSLSVTHPVFVFCSIVLTQIYCAIRFTSTSSSDMPVCRMIALYRTPSFPHFGAKTFSPPHTCLICRAGVALSASAARSPCLTHTAVLI